MYVRKRGQFYHYEFWVENKRYAGSFNGKNGSPVAADKREARDLASAERLKVLAGTYNRLDEREGLKDFVTFVDQVYLPFAKEHHSDPDHAEFRAAILKDAFGGRRFDEITMMAVVKYLNDRLNSQTVRRLTDEDGTKVNCRRSPTTVNKEVTLLSSIFRMAIREKVATSNPCDDLPKSVRAKIPARRRRNRRLMPPEEKVLFDVGLRDRREHIREVTEAALYTGMRKGELLRLKPEHVNFGRTARPFVIDGETLLVRPGWLVIERSKNGLPRTIPMSQRVRGLLEKLCAAGGEYVFSSIRTGGRITDIKKAFRSACLEAEVLNFTFHDLRHEWSSRAADMGVPEHVRRDILGHKSKSMTGDYTHASPEAMEHAMELVADYAGGSFFNLGKISANQEAAAG